MCVKKKFCTYKANPYPGCVPNFSWNTGRIHIHLMHFRLRRDHCCGQNRVIAVWSWVTNRVLTQKVRLVVDRQMSPTSAAIVHAPSPYFQFPREQHPKWRTALLGPLVGQLQLAWRKHRGTWGQKRTVLGTMHPESLLLSVRAQSKENLETAHNARKSSQPMRPRNMCCFLEKNKIIPAAQHAHPARPIR